MDIIQTFRRLSQKNIFGDMFSVQHHQVELIKKLYAKNGLVITGGGAMPEQYEVFKDGQRVAYYRLRHGDFTVDCPGPSGEEIFDAEPNGDGAFDGDERLNYLTKAMRLVLKHIGQ